MAWEKQKAVLERRRRDLEARLVGIEMSLDAARPADWAESAVEREGDEVLEGLGAQGLRELGQIRAALHRMELGTYGDCVACGAPIAEKRIALVPEAPLCASCAGGRQPQAGPGEPRAT
ncbi:dimethylmenaquinone methyltransferase [Salipiger aestuarii]|uniref:TraR/DksA family transcriptional regulator n=3 Tax=Salipiger aestuarii TaxID=568098 RepID=A0A327YIB5_9RHOB|nr:dimethylmenaquinone methyltransferase [Salipiger aestuarii]KAA8615247.1 dimethylmenaquinone methyltransferase [Salipiger aestuarii]KAB2542958.1 dimethylmenaquinone methyltransferase [Salipiger aestuarii]RAK20768.1 TraR/DksA family transcriptional regulator [Salipiger aestuarii]